MNKLTANEVRQALEYCLALIKKPAKGALKYDYLVPGGPYSEQWDWDAFFMGVALTSENSKDAIYLKNWSLNCLENATAEGKIPGCITPAGADPRLNHMKPFLAQGSYIACSHLADFSWLSAYWGKICKVVAYREQNLWNHDYGLGVWFDSMESGADNNVAALDYPNRSVVATDLNAFLYREYLALAAIAEKLGKNSEAPKLAAKAEDIKARILKYLWNEEDQVFYNLNATDGSQIKVVSYSSFIPLWASLASAEQGRASVQRYLINPQSMWGDFGIRTLSKDHPRYNNVNMIKPHSNWQGPVWPIANYLYMRALLNYGFKEKAAELAQIISRLVLGDIKRSGGMHENYDAENGEPLAAPNFVSWNILVRNMIDEAASERDPFKS